jgi:hypothetical protein
MASYIIPKGLNTMKRFRNMVNETKSYCGMDVEPYGFYDIEPARIVQWANDLDVITALINGTGMMNDGSNDYGDPIAGLNFLKDIKETDGDGAPVFSPKTNSVGWTYKKVGIDFITCEPDSLFYLDFEGNEVAILSMRCYNAANQLLTTQEDRDLYCVKTVIDALPTHDIELVGGTFKTLTPFNNGRIWFVVAPDFPAPLGCKVLAENIALKFDTSFTCDGRNRKKLKYNGGIGSNKMRGVITHAAGEKFACQFLLEEFIP